MANRNLFQSIRGALLPRTNAVNEAGGVAYTRTAEGELAQLAATGCLSNTFYATAESQLAKVLELADQVDVDFLARTALYSRRKGLMKDMPFCQQIAFLRECSGDYIGRRFESGSVSPGSSAW